MGIVKHISWSGGGILLGIEPHFDLSETKIGESISVDGVCLTVTEIKGHVFYADVSQETLRVSNLKDLRVGGKVNLERALRPMDRMGGHFVQGHVDGMAVIKSKGREGSSFKITFSASEDLTRYIVAKGSVAVDGISLTVNECSHNEFSVNIVPHTVEKTTILTKEVGDEVNIENDILGKYVEKFLMYSPKEKEKKRGIDLNFLVEKGFL